MLLESQAGATRFTRGERVPAPRDLLGSDSLRAFEAYFATEQANLETLAGAAAEDPHVAAF